MVCSLPEQFVVSRPLRWFGLTWQPRGVLGISSDGDDRRIFLGLKFSIPGFFWVRKFGKGLGLGSLKESVVPWLRSSANKVETNVFFLIFNS